MNNASTPSNPYLLFFRNVGPETFAPLSNEQRQQLVTRWNDWFEGLLSKGKAIEGQPLDPDTRLVSGPGGQRVVDGPFPEAKEAIAGYVMLTVDTMEEATAIAQQHPALAYGMKIEVRRLADGCRPLGVTVRTRMDNMSATS